MKRKRVNISFSSDTPLPPKWAWRIALWLPEKVRDSVNLMFLSTCMAVHKNGSEATIREIMEELRPDDHDITVVDKDEMTFEHTEGYIYQSSGTNLYVNDLTIPTNTWVKLPEGFPA